MPAPKPEGEVREIFSHLKNLLMANRDLCLDPPPLLKAVFNPVEPAKPVRRQETSQESPSDSLEALESRIGNCRRCKLSENRRHLVFGEGSPHARLVFVGEGPGREEDRIGRPFVGKAGDLLTRIIENEKAMGLSRQEVYICNVVKCRPPGNRDPEKDEVLIIGDSLTSDIQGGNDYGIDTCWFNPDKKPCDQDVTVDYEIRKPSELLKILDKA